MGWIVLSASLVGKLDLSFLQLAKSHGNVFATDAIIATLMCCTRSVYSWDVIVQRVGKKLFFDKRDGSDFGELWSPERESSLFLRVRVSCHVKELPFTKCTDKPVCLGGVLIPTGFSTPHSQHCFCSD